MQGSKTELNIYVALQLLCALLTATGGGGLVLSLCKYIVFAWSFAYYFKTFINFQKEPTVIKALTVFYLSLAIYGIIVLVEGKSFEVGRHYVTTVVPANYIFKTTWSLLPIFVFYHFTKKGQLTKQYMLKWLYVFVAVATISYFWGFQMAMERKQAEVEEATNNAGYLAVSLIPMFVFLKDRSWKQYLPIAGAILLAIMSMKRGSILVGFLAVAVYFWYLFKNSKRSTQLKVAIALLIAVFGVFSVYERMATTSKYFQERVDETMEGDTNGRDVIHTFFIEYYLDQYTPTEQLIGKGANATLDIYGMFAHNDWIELGINQGLLGMLLYLFFWIAFAKTILKRDVPPKVKTALAMLFEMYFLKTFFSMSYSDYTLYASMVLGFGIAVACDAGKAKKKYLLDLE